MLQTHTFHAAIMPLPARTAAMYVRMSTDHQKYSTENQADAIRSYADRYGIDITHTYTDAGKSGLSLDGRDALKKLIDDVQEGRATYSMILVLDVTRWGRFQDADESAYYEYICRRAGIEVQYVAEQFENDGSPVSTIVKGVKRAMAGEYSRELSAKVFAGQCKLVEKGFRQGGPAGYGMRRVLVDEQGNLKAELRRGEQKSLQTDRVILVPGPPEELETIREIYRRFVVEAHSELEIATWLNASGIRRETGAPWSRPTVLEILTNEKYIGNNVFNRRSFKLKKRRVANSPEMWVRADGVFAPIVDAATFAAAQERIQARSRRLSDDELLEKLKALLDREGWLSGKLISSTPDMPSAMTYASRFGSLTRAYELIGHAPERDLRYVSLNRTFRLLKNREAGEFVSALQHDGIEALQQDPADRLSLPDGIEVAVTVCRHRVSRSGIERWLVKLEQQGPPDFTLAVRMDPTNTTPLDYYLLPALDLDAAQLRLFATNSLPVDNYRFGTRASVCAQFRRTPLKELLP